MMRRAFSSFFFIFGGTPFAASDFEVELMSSHLCLCGSKRGVNWGEVSCVNMCCGSEGRIDNGDNDGDGDEGGGIRKYVAMAPVAKMES